ncbi:MAG: hypothetical protein HZC16_02145 [Candidatus Omnitrophica bacterium]|nr:hypothetical protein [Candidatus Omnitrophota bacterium]
MKNKTIFLALFFIVLVISYSFAGWQKKPEFRWTQVYRYDLRRNHYQLYNNRLSLTLNYLDKEEKPLFKLTPFFEIRRNINKDLWERKELGIEFGKDIFSWLYLGEAIQKGWMKEDYRNYRDYEKRDYAELETRLCLSHNLLSKKSITLKGFILNEYTYDFDEGAGMRNEVVAGLMIPIGKHIETGINWRHIDRIHYYDSDTAEAFATLVF